MNLGERKSSPGEGWREGSREEGPRSGGDQRLSDGAEGVGGCGAWPRGRVSGLGGGEQGQETPPLCHVSHEASLTKPLSPPAHVV